jgi:hypothetical protein
LRSAAWVAGGIGIAALVLGAGPGAVVLGDKATIDAHCRSDDTCDAQGLSAADQARTLGAVSTAGFVVGGVAIATALVLLVASSTHHPPRSGASAWTPVGVAGPGGEFVGLRGTW